MSTRAKVAEPSWLVTQIGRGGWVKLSPATYTQKDKVPLAAATLEYKKSFK